MVNDRRHGVDPEPTTITPNWNGDKLDLDWTVLLLLNNPVSPTEPQSLALDDAGAPVSSRR